MSMMVMTMIDSNSSHLLHTYYVPGTYLGSQPKKQLLHHIPNEEAEAQSRDIIKTTVFYTQTITHFSALLQVNLDLLHGFQPLEPKSTGKHKLIVEG